MKSSISKSQFNALSLYQRYAYWMLRIIRSLHEIMAKPFCDCTDNLNAQHVIMRQMPVTRETGMDCGESRG